MPNQKRKRRLWERNNGLKPVRMPLAQFLNAPPIFAQDLEKQFIEQRREEHSIEIKSALRNLAGKAVQHDNQSKMDALKIQAAELKASRERKQVADKFVAASMESNPSVAATRSTLFGNTRTAGETPQQATARRRRDALIRELEFATDSGDKTKAKTLTVELDNLNKYLHKGTNPSQEWVDVAEEAPTATTSSWNNWMPKLW